MTDKTLMTDLLVKLKQMNNSLPMRNDEYERGYAAAIKEMVDFMYKITVKPVQMKINNVLCFIDHDGIKDVEFHDTTPITLEFGNDKFIGFAKFTVKESGVYADIEIDPKYDTRVAGNNKLYPYLSGITEHKKPLKITGMALGIMPNVDSRIPAIHPHQIESYA